MPHTTNPTSSNLFMIVAPSGAGKSTLVNELLAQEPDIQLSISYTTRPPRPGDIDGQHYHFISVDEFLARHAQHEFLESAQVHSNYYGTSRLSVLEQMSTGSDVLLEIDWQGAQQIKKQFPTAVGIFILPPSIDTLEERLRLRGQDDSLVITKRILAAGGEIAHAGEFEYVIINQDFATALSELSAIIKATRCRFSRQAVRNASLFAQLGIHADLQ